MLHSERAGFRTWQCTGLYNSIDTQRTSCKGTARALHLPRLEVEKISKMSKQHNHRKSSNKLKLPEVA